MCVYLLYLRLWWHPDFIMYAFSLTDDLGFWWIDGAWCSRSGVTWLHTRLPLILWAGSRISSCLLSSGALSLSQKSPASALWRDCPSSLNPSLLIIFLLFHYFLHCHNILLHSFDFWWPPCDTVGHLPGVIWRPRDTTRKCKGMTWHDIVWWKYIFSFAV